RRIGAGCGIALAVLHDEVDLVFLVADRQSTRLVHGVGPHLVSTLGDLPTGRVLAGQLQHRADLERVGRRPAALVAAARGEEARAGNRTAHHEPRPGEETSTVDVVGHGYSSLSRPCG